MVFRILGEVVAGLLVAGLVSGFGVGAAMQAGYEPGPWAVWVVVAISIAACIAGGERRNKRREAASRLDRGGAA